MWFGNYEVNIEISMYFYLCMRVWYICLCAWVCEGQRIILGIFFSRPLIFWSRVFHFARCSLIWCSLIHHCLTISMFQAPACLSLIITGTISIYYYAWFLYIHSGSELRFSWLICLASSLVLWWFQLLIHPQ